MSLSSAYLRSPAAVRRKRWVRLAMVVLLSCLVGLALASATTAIAAQADDTTPPTLQDGQRDNVSTIQVTVTDDTDVDETSINASDFTLSDGDVAGVQANESGADATVKLFLDARLNTDEITVAIAADGEILDSAGNALTDDSVTVTGMDSYLPHLREYRVERLNTTDARIVVRANEPLDRINLTVRGPANTTLTEADFDAVDDNKYGIPHVATHHFPEDGIYRLQVTNITDRAGHLVNYTNVEPFVRDPTDPEAAIDGPSHLNTDDRGRFNGSQSTDNVGIASYNWTVDGTEAGNGTVFEPTFTGPGTHVIGVTVTDHRGNTATVNHSVVVHEAPSKDGVTVTAGNYSRVNATIAAGRASDRVRVADAYGRLLGDDDVTLRSLTVTLPTDETATVNISATDADPSFEAATGRTALATYTVDHGDQTVEDPTFRFSVSRSRLTRAGVSYADIGLYRDDGNWTELETGIVRATKSAVVYEATAPGLSTFVVGTTAAGRESYDAGDSGASIRVAEASLVTESVALGEYAVINATLVNEGDVDGTYLTGLSIGPRVVLTRPVTVPARESRQIQFVTRATRSGTVAVNGTIAGTLSVEGATSTNDGTDPTSDKTESSGGGGLPIPNPLALWPRGIVGAVLTGVISVTVVTYSVLKALAIYLGY